MAVGEKSPLEWAKEIAEGNKSEKERLLVKILNPGADIDIRERLSIALALVHEWTGEGREERVPDETERATLSFIRDIFLIDKERGLLFSLLIDMDLPALKEIRTFLFRDGRDSAITSGHRGEWTALLRRCWEKHRTPQRALLYCESIFDAICFEEREIKEIPMPSHDAEDEILRELLRRKLFSSIHNSDPRWNIDRPRKALKVLQGETPSQEEQAFSGLGWRIYEMAYQYGLELENRAELRRIAQDLLEMEDREPYEVYSRIFRSKESRFRVDGACALIKATQFRTRRPRGPAEEFRKKALETLKITLDTTEDAVLQRVLSFYRGMGEIRPIIECFRKLHQCGGKASSLYAFDEALLCWKEGLSPDEHKEILPDMLSLVEIAIKEGTPDYYELLSTRIVSLSSHADFTALLRKSLKALLADVDVASEVRKRALTLLSCIGSSNSPDGMSKKQSTLLDIVDELDEEEENPPCSLLESAPSPVADSKELDDVVYLAHHSPLPPQLLDFLKRKGKPEDLKRECARIIKEGRTEALRFFPLLFTAFDGDTGRPLFEHRMLAARAMIEFVSEMKEGGENPGPENLDREEKAKESLLWAFFHRDCPDLIKMEAFELLNNLHYFDLHRADSIKKYAIAFAKHALFLGASSAPCRALADLIDLRSATHSLLSLEGKSNEELMEDLIAHLFKEKDGEKREKWLDLLHYVSFQDPGVLKPLLARIHPLHYREALDIVSHLLLRFNSGAGNLILEAVTMDFRDIRNHAVRILGTMLPYLSKEQVRTGASHIIDKIDECYDEEVKNDYLEVLRKMDPLPVAEKLLTRCPDVGLSERKEFGNLLMKSLERLPARFFIPLFDKGATLVVIKKFILSGPGDSFMKLMAKRFLGLYRENFIGLSGKEAWEALQNSPTDRRWMILKEISRAL
jgi:hypothetical protein